MEGERYCRGWGWLVVEGRGEELERIELVEVKGRGEGMKRMGWVIYCRFDGGEGLEGMGEGSSRCEDAEDGGR